MAIRLFDKEGRPIVLSPRTRRLMPRRFRNPGGRGTCESLYNDDGEVLLVDADSSVPEVRQAVNFVPGLYRLDQCDEDGNEITGAPAGYLSIDPPRNAATPAITDPLAMCGMMAQTNADVSKTFADKAAGMMDAVVECVRVLGGIPSKRLLANATLAVKPEADDDEDDDDEDDDRDDRDGAPPTPAPEPAPSGPAAMLAWFTPAIEEMAPEIGKEIGAKVVELLMSFLRRTPAAAPASTATPASAPAREPAPSGVDAGGAAAGSGAEAPPRSNPRPAAAPPPKSPPTASPPPEPPAAASAPEPSPSPAPSSSSIPSDPPSPPASTVPLARVAIPSRPVSPAPTSLISPPRNAPPTITAEQLRHYFAIRAALTAREVALVEGVIRKLNERGDHARREELIAELMSRTVEQGVEFVRAYIREAFGDRAAAGKG